MIIAEANCVGASGERCFRTNNGESSGTRYESRFVDFAFPRGYIFFFFFPRGSVPVYMRSRLLFFSFFDENVMSEVEIAGRGPSNALKVRMEFAVLRNKAININ